MTAPLPLLRSPPFPWVAPDVAAVSARADAWAPPPDPARTAALAAAIREARVGGAFWADPVRSDAAVIIRPRSARDLGDLPAKDALAVLPGATGSAPLRRALADAGVAVHGGEVDPWSLLRPGVTLHAHADDEWALLAPLAGASLHLLSGEPPPLADALSGVRHRDPFTGEAASPEDAVALLALWRTVLDANRRVAAVAGIAWWKREAIERFLWVPRPRPLRFVRTALDAVDAARAAGGAVATWPSRTPPGLLDRAREAGVAVHRVEDGFIRSIGLGSDLREPFSVVVDPLGIHYDPAAPSELERLLETADFPHPLLDRAAALVDAIVRAGISKYAAGGGGPGAPRSGRRRILVTGQVEDDLSVRSGGAHVAGNLDLLRRARALEPDAELWYRPHPDVDAGHRRGAVADTAALALADRVARGGSVAGLLGEVDGVHVLTSLTGFEALLRGLPVTTHGTPFYAGWGLTRDLAPAPARRTRRLTIGELAAGALILYPRYRDPITGLPCPPEVLMRRFSADHAAPPTWLTRVRRAEGRVRRAVGAR